MGSGEVAARYLEDCARSGRAGLIGYTLDPEGQRCGAGAVHVVLDPVSRGIPVYDEFCQEVAKNLSRGVAADDLPSLYSHYLGSQRLLQEPTPA